MTKVAIDELWAVNLSADTFYNIERDKDSNPEGGGGAGYIQIAKSLVPDLLVFLRSNYPTEHPIELMVGSRNRPTEAPTLLTFSKKSQGRMRISNQNRFKAIRHPAWLPERGFPTLQPGERKVDAEACLEELGGIHIFIARSIDGSVWADFTTGGIPEGKQKDPFSSILYGSSKGGYWKYEEKK